jgi:tetratricopeptide (TPR) repeat protein
MQIRPEPAKALSARQECEIVRRAVARNPASGALRLRLARLLNQLDAFDEAIAVLTVPDKGEGALDHAACLALAAACFARDRPGDTTRAGDAAIRAETLASTDAERSAALAEQAKALLRMDRNGAARALLTEALRLDPGNTHACRRLVTDLLRTGDAEAVIAVTDRLAAQGIGHARLFAARMLAFARLGRIEEARATTDLAAFRYRQPLTPPPGWDDIDAFNTALVDELKTHPGLRYERHGTASQATWRIDALATGAAPIARALLGHIAETAERHVASLAGHAHPWLAARPDAGVLRSWCVITEGDGFEKWHAHPSGWMSGVYYARVPETVANGSDVGGCIAFGLPDGLIGAENAARFGEDLVRPQPGLLMLFPSHSYHRTFPHGAADRRICVSFDIWPA